MSSGFFIRSKRKLDSSKVKRSKNAKKERFSEKNSKHKNSERTEIIDDEDIASTDDEFSEAEPNKVIEDDEEPLTAQEKKLQLAKKYIEEIEREERERLENAEIDSEVVASRLKEDAISEAGKLKTKIADKLQGVHEIYSLRNKDHSLAVTCVVVSSDSKYIYSASKDCFIVKWDLMLKQKVNSISSAHKLKNKSKIGHGGNIISLAISYDNRFLVSGDVKHFIHVWNPLTLDHINCFKGHNGPITGLAICRSTNILYSSSGDRSIKVWNLDEMMYVETLFGHQSSAASIDVLSKNRAVSCGSLDNSIRIWKIDQESQFIFNGSGRTIDVVRRIDDDHCVSCGEDGLVCIWSVTKKKPLHVIKDAHGSDTITSEPKWVISVASMMMTDVFASGSSDGQVKVWKIEENCRDTTVLFTVPVNGFINSMVFSSDGKYLILGVGQEHKLGRWSRITEGKNSVVVIELKRKPETNGF